MTGDICAGLWGDRHRARRRPGRRTSITRGRQRGSGGAEVRPPVRSGRQVNLVVALELLAAVGTGAAGPGGLDAVLFDSAGWQKMVAPKQGQREAFPAAQAHARADAVP